MPILPASALKKTLEELPDDWAMKTGAVKGHLGKTVKEEELNWSGIGEHLDSLDPNTRMTKKDLADVVSDRGDEFKVTPRKDYSGTTLEDTDKATYFEDVLSFKESGVPRKVTSHYTNIPDYLTHTRGSVGQVGEIPTTRIIQEIQSDLHQQARHRGYADFKASTKHGVHIGTFDTKKEVEIFVRDYNIAHPNAEADYLENVHSKPPRSPLEKNWSRKAIERQVLSAINDGQDAIAIPLEGAAGDLKRSAGVQKWYETQIRGTLKKIAKQIPGAKYEEHTSGKGATKKNPFDNDDWYEQLEDSINTPEIENSIIKKAEELQLNNIIKDSIVGEYIDYANIASYLPTDELEKVLPKFMNEGVELDPNLLKGVVYANKDIFDAVAKILPKDTPLTSTAIMDTIHYNPNITADMWVRIYKDAVDRPGITMGQIVLPPMKRSTTKIWEHPPKDIRETYQFMDDTKLDLAETASEMREQGIVSKGPGSYYNIEDIQEYIVNSWEGFTQSQNLPISKTKTETPEWTKKFELYSAGGVAGAVGVEQDDPVGDAIDNGASPSSVLTHLIKNEGLGVSEAKEAMSLSVQKRIDAAIENGASPEAVQKYISETFSSDLFNEDNKFDFGEGGGDFVEEPFKGEQTLEFIPVGDPKDFNSEKSTETLINAKENLQASYGEVFENIGDVLITNNKEKIQRFEETMEANRYAVANTLRAMGKDVITQDGEYYERIGEEIIPITPEWYSKVLWAMAASEKEIAFGIAGAVGAEALASSVAGSYGKTLGWFSKTVIGVAGGSGGAAVGRGLDLAYNASVLGEDLEYEFYKRQMIDAGKWDAIMGSTLAVGFKAGKESIIHVGRALKGLVDGNRSGAYTALKEYFNLSDPEIDKIISEWEKTTGQKAPGITRATKAFHVLPRTESEGEALLAEARTINPEVGIKSLRELDTRAKELNVAASNLTTKNVTSIVWDDVGKYTTKVKDYYTEVKNTAVSSFKNSDYRFDYDDLGIDKVLEKTKETISNPAIQKRFELYSDKISVLGEARTFKDLLDLRKTLNDFKYNTKLRQHIDWELISGAINKVDQEISTIAQKELPDGKAWLKDWASANMEYSKMIKLRKNVMYKALTKKGVDPKNIIKSMSDHITDIDGTFMEVVGKLPTATRTKMEGAVFEHLTEKFTAGQKAGLQATDLVGLSEQLKHIAFSSQQARKLKRTVNELASIFKNDKDLAGLSGHMSSNKFQSYFTDNPVSRVKYELVSRIFTNLKSRLPTVKGGNAALVIKIAKAFKQPNDGRNVESIIKEMSGDPAIASGFHQLALVTAKFGEAETYPYVKVFKTGRSGREHKAINGRYGNGVYYTTDKGNINSQSLVTGAKVLEEELLPSRIATEADIKSILKVDTVTPKMIKESKTLQVELKKRGYDGFAMEHNVIMFKE